MKTNPVCRQEPWRIIGLVMAILPVTVVQAQTTTGKLTNQTYHRRYRRRGPLPNVTVTLANAPVRRALFEMFQKANVDFSLDERIEGTVVLKLTNKPFIQALNLIISNSSKPLTYYVSSGVFFVRPIIAKPKPVATAPMLTADDTQRRLPKQTAQTTENFSANGFAPMEMWDQWNPIYQMPGVVTPDRFPNLYFYPGYIMPYGMQSFNFMTPSGAIVTPSGIVIQPPASPSNP